MTTDGAVSGPNGPLRPWLTNCGYQQVRIRFEGRRRNLSVHRLVALTHVPNPEGHPQVDHRNGVKTDNRAANLEWVSAKENKARAMALGRDRWAGRTECPNGHDLSPANRFIRSSGKSECRLCQRDRDQERRARRKAINRGEN